MASTPTRGRSNGTPSSSAGRRRPQPDEERASVVVPRQAIEVPREATEAYQSRLSREKRIGFRGPDQLNLYRASIVAAASQVGTLTPRSLPLRRLSTCPSSAEGVRHAGTREKHPRPDLQIRLRPLPALPDGDESGEGRRSTSTPISISGPGIELIQKAGRRWETDKYQDLIKVAGPSRVEHRVSPDFDDLIERNPFLTIENLFDILRRPDPPLAIIEAEVSASR